MVVDSLPKIAAEVAAPLDKVDDIVIVGGGDGAAQLLATLPVNKNRRPSKTDSPTKVRGTIDAGPVPGIIDAGLKIAGGMKILESIASFNTPSDTKRPSVTKTTSVDKTPSVTKTKSVDKTPSAQSGTSL